MPRLKISPNEPTVRVNVARVPGEEKVDNNKADYPALFSRG